MTQETREWYNMAATDLGVARLFRCDLSSKAIGDNLLSLSTSGRKGNQSINRVLWY